MQSQDISVHIHTEASCYDSKDFEAILVIYSCSFNTFKQ